MKVRMNDILSELLESSSLSHSDRESQHHVWWVWKSNFSCSLILHSLLESSISVIICLKSLLSARTDCRNLNMLKPEFACNLTFPQIITGHYKSLHDASSRYGQKAHMKAKRSMKSDNLSGSIQRSRGKFHS